MACANNAVAAAAPTPIPSCGDIRATTRGTADTGEMIRGRFIREPVLQYMDRFR
jgi:hypothetical protein